MSDPTTIEHPVDPVCPWCLGDHGIRNPRPSKVYTTNCCKKQVKVADWDDGELAGSEMIKAGR